MLGVLLFMWLVVELITVVVVELIMAVVVELIMVVVVGLELDGGLVELITVVNSAVGLLVGKVVEFWVVDCNKTV